MNYRTLLLWAGVTCAATAANINVPAGGDLQAALDAAKAGDTIILPANASYIGNFNLAPNAGPGWITIQSSEVAALPAGLRVSRSDASHMPKIITPNNTSALTGTTGAKNYRFIGIEFTVGPGVYTNDIVRVGTASESTVDALPANFDFDRVYVHGDSFTGSKRGIALNGNNITVENSYFDQLFSTWQDTQAVSGWNAPGPFKIVNNHLEAGTEIVGFGGAVGGLAGVIPSDILIQGNYFYKSLSWKEDDPSYAGIPVWQKNHIEFKNGQRAVIDGNIFENCWPQQQRGFVLMLSVRTEWDAMPWTVVKDLTITNNIFRHVAAGVDFLGHDEVGNHGGQLSNVTVANNLWLDVGTSSGGDGRMFQVLNGSKDVNIDHNTIFEDGAIMVFDEDPSQRVNFTNNITNRGMDVAGDGTFPGVRTLEQFDADAIFTQNALIGIDATDWYNSTTYFPRTIDDVGFVNPAAGDYHLKSSSPYKNQGTDGKDLGANVDTIYAHTATVLSGDTRPGAGLSLTVTVTAAPGSVSLSSSQTQQFTATVTGLPNATVTWSLKGAGSLSDSGLYTAPATISSQDTAVVTATVAGMSVGFLTANTPMINATGSSTITLVPPVATSAGTTTSAGTQGNSSTGSSSSAQTSATPASISVFSGSTPINAGSFGANTPVEYGVKFRTDVAGSITGVRFYKGIVDSTTHTGSLWTADGTLLATGTFTGESATGWQELTFATPIAIQPNTTYIASYHTLSMFTCTPSYFQHQSADNGPLHLLKSGVDGGNGVMAFSAGGVAPKTTPGPHNFWVDVMFVPAQ